MSVQLNSAKYMQQMISGLMDQKKGAAAAQKFDVSSSVSVDVTTIDKTDTERTVEDVKKEFYDYLDSLPVTSGLGKTPINVTISEPAFERMLEDPEYMQTMKDLCKRDLCDPAWDSRGILGPPTYMHINITDNTNNEFDSEYVCSSYNYGTGQNFKSETANSFWSRRTKSESQMTQEKRQDGKRQLEKNREKRREKQQMLEQIFERSRDQKEFLSGSWSISFSQTISNYTQSASYTAQIGSVLTEA